MNMKRMRRGHRHGGGGGGGGGGPYRNAGGGGGGGGNGNQPLNRNHVFDSSGPDVRLRGTAQQLFEKYLQLGRDATGGGDRVAAEGYFQHAEHYFRILGAMNAAQQQQQQPAQGQGQQDRRYREPGEGYREQAENYGQDAAPSQDGEGGDSNGHASLEAELAGEAETLPMPQLRRPASEEPAQ